LQLVGKHEPPAHAAPAGQTTPTQLADVQLPLSQTAPVAQAVWPQLVGAQAPAAQAVPASQPTPMQAEVTHWPLKQTWAGPQGVVPQLWS
jgi:hypothetical protein